MPLSSGHRLGTYEILAPLGAGGMGEVYRARDTRLGRDVALKVLPSDVSADAGRLARFEREARTVAGLNHPNIVMLHSIEEEDGVRFLTMELVEGQTLSNQIMPGGVTVQRLLDLAIPLADALVAAHERGVVHRDLKPGNVMVTREGRVKVLDFGLAKSAGDEAAQDATMTSSPISGHGQALGTVPYMAPEQLRGDIVDARADLFALGILLFELATGHRPFRGDSAAEISSAILRDTPEPMNRVRWDLPPEIAAIVKRCLEKNPRDRVQTALDVSNELRRVRKAREAVASDQVATIAVLPFVNRSRDEEDEYFSDGLADELLSVLSKIKGLRVSARSSAFHFKGKDATIAEVGSALNVAAVLEGSVRKSGNRIRVSVQLVKVADGYHLWSETYDRTLDDIFAVQDDIAHSVVKELRTTLLGEAADSDASGEAKAEVAQAAKGRGADPEAHRLSLLARHLIDRRTPEDTEQGVAYLKQAVALDSEFALAWAQLGGAYMRQAVNGWVLPSEKALVPAREALARALSLEPDLPEAHVHEAWIRVSYDFDWRGAEASIRRALELAPGDAVVLQRAGAIADARGRIEEAIGFHRRAIEQNPLSAPAWNGLGLALANAGRFTEAEAAERKAIEIAPGSHLSWAHLAMMLNALGRSEEALDVATRQPDKRFRLWGLAIIHHGMGHLAESDAALEELTGKYPEDLAFQIAEAHGVRGETEKAFEWLERAYVQRDGGLLDLLTSRHLRGLHSDPRWSLLVKKMGHEG